MMFVRLSVCLSVCLSGKDLSLWLYMGAQCSGHPDTNVQSMSTYSQPSFCSSTWKRGGVWMCFISQEQLKIEDKLLLSGNRKSYMPCRLAQQWMTLSDLEWPFHASNAISAAAELLVSLLSLWSLNCAKRIYSFYSSLFSWSLWTIVTRDMNCPHLNLYSVHINIPLGSLLHHFKMSSIHTVRG